LNTPSISGDTPDARCLWLVITGVLASACLYAIFYLPRGNWDYNFGYGYGRDFGNFWAAGRLSWLGETALLFDVPAYNAWLGGQLGRPIEGGLVYSYPPSILLMLMPIGALPYGAALALWTATQFGLAAAAVQQIAGRDRRAIAFAWAAPALALSAFQGQMIVALAALFLIAVVTLDRRPVLAGICLGVLTIKPQLGVVLGLIVLIERRWTVLFVTVATAAMLIAASVWIGGTSVWTKYAAVTVPLHQKFLSEFTAGFIYFTATPYAFLRGIGVSSAVAMTVHALTAIPLVVLALIYWTRQPNRLAAICVVGLVSVLATPYANIYDLAIPALPLAILLARGTALQDFPPLAIVAVWLIPAVAMPLAAMTVPVAGLLLLAAVSTIFVAAHRRDHLFAPENVRIR
jgi:Glycosyltransferase family 87